MTLWSVCVKCKIRYIFFELGQQIKTVLNWSHWSFIVIIINTTETNRKLTWSYLPNDGNFFSWFWDKNVALLKWLLYFFLENCWSFWNCNLVPLYILQASFRSFFKAPVIKNSNRKLFNYRLPNWQQVKRSLLKFAYKYSHNTKLINQCWNKPWNWPDTITTKHKTVYWHHSTRTKVK